MSNTQKDPQKETPVENTNYTNHTIELVLLSLAALFFAVIGIAQLVVFADGYGF
jgi:hypothetical protein